jgi:hypothetical protein
MQPLLLLAVVCRQTKQKISTTEIFATLQQSGI